MGLWELCWRWGWTSRVSSDKMQVFSSWASWCLLLWRTEWGLRQPADAKCLLNFIKDVSLCFCVTWNHYLTSLFPPLPRLMLMFLPPAAVDQQVPVCWCVLCVMANVNRVIVKSCCWVGTVGTCQQQQNQLFKHTFPALSTGLTLLQPTLSSQSPRVP